MEGDFILMYIPSKKIKAAKFRASCPLARSEEKKKVIPSWEKNGAATSTIDISGLKNLKSWERKKTFFSVSSI